MSLLLIVLRKIADGCQTITELEGKFNSATSSPPLSIIRVPTSAALAGTSRKGQNSVVISKVAGLETDSFVIDNTPVQDLKERHLPGGILIQYREVGSRSTGHVLNSQFRLATWLELGSLSQAAFLTGSTGP